MAGLVAIAFEILDPTSPLFFSRLGQISFRPSDIASDPPGRLDNSGWRAVDALARRQFPPTPMAVW